MDPSSDAAPFPVSRLAAVGPGRSEGMKVLIVDDEPLIGYALRSLVEQEGSEAVTTRTGEEGLRLLVEKKPDLVILDVHLPDANGVALLEEILHMRPSTAVIIMTAAPDGQDRDAAMKKGALDYIVKPLSVDYLRSQLRKPAGDK